MYLSGSFVVLREAFGTFVVSPSALLCARLNCQVTINCHITAVLRRSREDGNYSHIAVASLTFYFSSPEIVLCESDDVELEHEHCGTFGRDDIALIGTPATIFPRTS